ncbi:hypothetical protein ACHAXA_005276 [Cyclostephanos tholiformis]|uniref:Uncharacterized protein n=1 Tax=Cyclostephanos tholiformis TaxID=382380 RepID=A0ABD3R8V5_9STRA
MTAQEMESEDAGRGMMAMENIPSMTATATATEPTVTATERTTIAIPTTASASIEVEAAAAEDGTLVASALGVPASTAIPKTTSSAEGGVYEEGTDEEGDLATARLAVVADFSSFIADAVDGGDDSDAVETEESESSSSSSSSGSGSSSSDDDGDDEIDDDSCSSSGGDDDDEDDDDDDDDEDEDDDAQEEDEDDDIEAAILTREQVGFLGDVSTMGEAFYSAYGNVVGRRGGAPSPRYSNDDDSGRAALSLNDGVATRKNRGKEQKRGVGPTMGRDRATLRGTVAREVTAASTRRAVASGVRRKVGRVVDGIGDIDDVDEDTGWSDPRRRRLCCGLISVVVCFVVGASLIAYGITREGQYRGRGHDRTSSGGTTSEGGGGKDDEDENVDGDETAPIDYSFPQPSPIHSQLPTISSDEPPDDALLILLKQSYYDALRWVGGSGNVAAVASDIVSNAQDIWLDRRTNFGKSPDEQTPQYRAYEYMFSENALLVTNDDDRLLQMYALIVFYETFDLKAYRSLGGIDVECTWPGVTCREIDNSDSALVVGLNFGGRNEDASGSAPIFLEGSLPVELMLLSHLETLDVSHNFLEGKLFGAMVASWKEMKVLDLNDNQFEGNIPSELGSLSKLQKISLHHNNFEGEVPEEICHLRSESLSFLWVDCYPLSSTNLPKVFCPIDSCCTICFEGDDNVQNEPAVDTSHAVASDATSDLKSLLSSKSTDKGAALADIHSPQYRAFAWLVADESYAQVYTTQRLLQRYALATLYFATNGPNWLKNEENDVGGAFNDTSINQADVSGDLLASLKDMSHDDGASLDDLLSPQFKAYNWLVTSGNGTFYGPNITSDIHFLQRYGLAVLFFSTAGHGWIQNTRWLTSGDVCEWDFVKSCNDRLLVTELDLNSNNLVGRIPIELTYARMLEILDLTDNKLYGSIPTEFGSLHDMEILRLGGNLLTGNIPPELADMSNLQALYLHKNE